MKRGHWYCLCLALLTCCVPARAVFATTDIWLLDIDGAIGPASAAFVVDNIEQSQHQAQALVLRIDTPGGLDKAMRDINKAIIASTIPILAYVAPGGAHAASAGTYILYACHYAAMAPGTNLGAATPVAISSPALPQQPKNTEDDNVDAAKPADAMKRKMVNDSVAYIRALAQLRQRNADWAESAVREAASLPAQQALEAGVINSIALDVDELIKQAGAASPVIDASNYRIVLIEADWRQRLLAIITDPNIAYILMLIGIYGLILEFYNPGVLVPGIVGAISLLLALYAFQVLPISYAALALVILGISLMLAEVMAPSFGMLGIGGAIAFAAGSVMLMDSDLPGYQIARPLIISAVAVSALLCMGVAGFAVRARRQPVVSGMDSMIGMPAEALEDFEHCGKVQIGGEIWQGQSATAVKRGSQRRVRRIEGLTAILEQED